MGTALPAPALALRCAAWLAVTGTNIPMYANGGMAKPQCLGSPVSNSRADV